MKYYPDLKKIDKEIKNSLSVGGILGNEHKSTMIKGGVYKQENTGYPYLDIDFKNGKKGLHPTQKPVALLEYLIKTYTLENETVLDFTMGSGSTGVACKNLNRSFIGIEQDQKYFKIAEKRINGI